MLQENTNQYAAKTILIVDDESDILEILKFTLERQNFNVKTAISGSEALRLINENLFDAIVLDLMLPGINGLEVLRQLKKNEKWKLIPVLMLTAKSSEEDMVAGLELGADDYIGKPFSSKVLVARLHSLLRRFKNTDEDGLIFGDLQIFLAQQQVIVNKEEIFLTRSQFGILFLLASKMGRVYSRSQIIDEVHGSDYAVTERSIDVQIVGLRKKLGICGDYIVTVRGTGYKFKL